METPTPINHSEIFSSKESLLKFLAPKKTETEKFLHTLYNLPYWHPASYRGSGAILGVEIDGEEIKLFLGLGVNPKYPIETSLDNNWFTKELYSGDLKKIADYFVEGTFIGGLDGGINIIENGPKEFICVYSALICSSCQEKESAKTNDG